MGRSFAEAVAGTGCGATCMDPAARSAPARVPRYRPPPPRAAQRTAHLDARTRRETARARPPPHARRATVHPRLGVQEEESTQHPIPRRPIRKAESVPTETPTSSQRRQGGSFHHVGDFGGCA
eukprot:363700-Chlamydomonas_euryale.AAC.6